MSHSIEQTVLEALERMKISYQLTQHEAAMTMADLETVDQAIGVSHVKNLFLCNRQQTNFYLLLLRGDQTFRTATASKQLGVARLSFGSPEHLMKLMQMEPGGISPLGLLFDRDRLVQLLLERSLLKDPLLCVHPCVITACVVISRDDFMNIFLRDTGHRPKWVDLSAAQQN